MSEEIVLKEVELRLDIRELTEVVALALEVCDSSHLIFADGKVGFEDISALWGLIQKLGPAYQGIALIPAELKDLSSDELKSLTDMIMADYAIHELPAQEAITKALIAIRAIYDVYLAIRG